MRNSKFNWVKKRVFQKYKVVVERGSTYNWYIMFHSMILLQSCPFHSILLTSTVEIESSPKQRRWKWVVKLRMKPKGFHSFGLDVTGEAFGVFLRSNTTTKLVDPIQSTMTLFSSKTQIWFCCEPNCKFITNNEWN